jgi:hypothetical protein
LGNFAEIVKVEQPRDVEFLHLARFRPFQTSSVQELPKEATMPPETLSDEDVDAVGGSLFTEPTDYYLPEKPPTFIPYTLNEGQSLNLRLVGHNPLWVQCSFRLHLNPR